MPSATAMRKTYRKYPGTALCFAMLALRYRSSDYGSTAPSVPTARGHSPRPRAHHRAEDIAAPTGCSCLITPILANIVGPPCSATRINASIAACHAGALCSRFGSFVT